MKLHTVMTLSALGLLAACAHQPADTAFNHIDSGINSQNGGGQNSTGGLVNGDLVTVSTGSGVAAASKTFGTNRDSPTSGLGGPSADPAYVTGRQLPDNPEAR